MSQLEFNVKAKFVYTKLLPLVKEALYHYKRKWGTTTFEEI